MTQNREYLNLMANDRRSWRDFNRIIEALNKQKLNPKQIENNKKFIKALERWRKRDDKLTKYFLHKQSLRDQERLKEKTKP